MERALCETGDNITCTGMFEIDSQWRGGWGGYRETDGVTRGTQ